MEVGWVLVDASGFKIKSASDARLAVGERCNRAEACREMSIGNIGGHLLLLINICGRWESVVAESSHWLLR